MCVFVPIFCMLIPYQVEQNKKKAEQKAGLRETQVDDDMEFENPVGDNLGKIE